ncbi:BglG family transcription antiterminator [Lactiplantibacillus daowaiensis]|uniref:BglG family transcription antiterminator n=1 Tax=Lactiplantibacillus daowaiensis TaxID=2559918 RepID=A0ABW1S0V3_9LACO|nr:PRD domain-containing protein [Lactiplantibacillus daowaiensis]
MSFEEKAQVLLEILSQQDRYLTSNDIAKRLGISTRTVMRYIERINEGSDVGKLISSEKGKGYKLEYKKYLKSQKHEKHTSDFSPVERRNEVLLRLLFSAPKKLLVSYLFEKYFVSDTAINADLLVIKDQLKGLDVELVRKNHRVGVAGHELAIRRAILQNISKVNDIETEKISSEFPALNTFDMRFIIDQFRSIENQLDSIIPYPYNVNIFSHLYILVNRYRKGIVPDQKVPAEIKLAEQKAIEENPDFYQIANRVINNLSGYLGQALPREEKYYLLQYLSSSRLFSEGNGEPVYSEKVAIITLAIIKRIGQVTGINFNVEQLKPELMNHIKPLLNRIRNHIEITNKLLADIQTEYPDTFTSVKLAVNQVFEAQFQRNLSDDEIGFITLYFAKFIEQNPTETSVLIMCASGIGTSELLKVKVHKFFPELRIEDVVSLRQYQNRRAQYDRHIDFIITTIAADNISTKPVLLVNAMFNKNDQTSVKRMLKELRINGN